MNWVSSLKKKVKSYFAKSKKKKPAAGKLDTVRTKAMAKAKSIGLTTVNARQYATLKPEDQAEIDRMLGRNKKKKSNGGK